MSIYNPVGYDRPECLYIYNGAWVDAAPYPYTKRDFWVVLFHRLKRSAKIFAFAERDLYLPIVRKKDAASILIGDVTLYF